jgi:hypothetical protein
VPAHEVHTAALSRICHADREADGMCDAAYGQAREPRHSPSESLLASNPTLQQVTSVIFL